MESTRFDRLARFMTQMGNRRNALSVAAVSGLAAAGTQILAAEAKDDLNAEGKKRGPRGRRGKRGHRGDPSGAGAVVLTETCTLPLLGAPPAIGDTAECTALCDENYVAVGGGHSGPKLIEDLGYVLASHPNTDTGAATGWTIEVEFLNIGPEFDVTTFVVCLPA